MTEHRHILVTNDDGIESPGRPCHSESFRKKDEESLPSGRDRFLQRTQDNNPVSKEPP